MNKKICFYTSEKEAKKDAEKIIDTFFISRQTIGMIMDLKLFLFFIK